MLQMKLTIPYANAILIGFVGYNFRIRILFIFLEMHESKTSIFQICVYVIPNINYIKKKK